MRRWKRFLAWTAGILAIVLAVLWLGTLVHEGGHALVAMALGARVTEMNVLGLNVYPALRFHFRPAFFGYVQFDRTLPSPQADLVRSAGSLSTLAVALLAQTILWAKPSRRPWARLTVIGFSFSWLDLLWHTSLPLLGLRGRGYAETYGALVALGVPSWLVGTAVFGSCAVLLTLTLVRWRQLGRPHPRLNRSSGAAVMSEGQEGP